MRTRFALTVGLVALGLVVWGGAPALAADVTINVPTTFAVADASDGALDGVFNVTGNLTITSTGSITCNDTGVSGASACPITIVVTGNLLMQAGSQINSENQTDGGSAGAITITVGGDMTMCGQTGLQAGCVAPAGNPGALISSRNLGSTSGGGGGYITIAVGSQATATGNFYMEGGATGYGTETGAKILSTAVLRAGDISVTAGGTYFTEPGSVVEAGGPTGTGSANQHGAKIFLISDCGLTSQGRVTSKGPDPAADLVHLESCTVLIEGLVESTGKGHITGAANSCDSKDDGLPGEVVRPGKPDNATGCIEVWGNFITIDSFNLNPATGLPWAGELNSDIGNGGAGGTSWIDIFAFSELTVIDGTGNDIERNNLGHTYFSTYAVHANTIDGSDNTPSVITALVKNGPLTASGKAFEASATMTSLTGHGTPDPDPFIGNGSNGGTIDLEASGTVTLDTAWVNASGDFTPTPGLGGHIFVSAWGTGSNLSWQNGDGDVQPDASGTIDLNACGTITTTGTNFHGETPTETFTCDATKPDIPDFIDGDIVFDQAAWALCGSSSVSGIKFNDLNGDHVRDGAEPVLPGWEIKIWNAAQTVLVATATTDGSGAYSFTVPADSYVVCETLKTGWLQTAPVAGTGVVACTNTGAAPLGYAVDLTSSGTCTGKQITGKDFGNIQLATKSGTKWNDVNGDHIREAGDVGLLGWTIHLFGTAVDGSAQHLTAVTDGSGNYSFTVLPGTYTVCEALVGGWTQTYPISGAACTAAGDPAADNPTPGPIGYSIVLTGGQNETGNDFGNTQPPQTATKSGMKFNDLNGNGLKELGEPGLANWPINLLTTTNVLVQTTNTAADGSYSFTIAVPGTYKVCEGTGPAGYVQTFPNGGTPPPSATDVPISTCPAPNAWGYQFIIAAGQNLTGDDFGNFAPVICQKQAVQTVLAGRIPDVTVRTDLNQSIQAAVDAASDTNGDGYIIVAVVSNATGMWGGSTTQNVVISRPDYPKPFLLIGCSVTMINPPANSGNPTGWIQTSAASPGNIFVMDLHGTGSNVAGWKVEGNGRELRNTGGSGNTTGIWFVGNNNIMHNGSAGSNSGVGLKIEGNGNYVTDTDAFGNTSHAVQVTGNSNQLLKIDAGDKGKGNGGDGLKVTGNSNTIQEVDAYANGLNGFEVSGTGNSLSKNVAGDRGGKGNGGAGFLLSGGSSLVQNTAIANSGDGFKLLTSGFSLKNNVSGGSGTGYANGGCQYKFVVAGNTNAGGNKSNGVTLSGTPFPAGCK